QVAEKISTLNPYPCPGLFQDETNYAYPDIRITTMNEGYEIALQDSFLPKISINHAYMDLKQTDAATNTSIHTNYQHCRWVMNSIEQLQKTVEKIATYIVQEETDLLQQGVAVLKPMTLSDVAAGIGMHASTISRATSNKVIAVPSGTF